MVSQWDDSRMRLMPVCICARARRPLTRGGAAGGWGVGTDRERPLPIEPDGAMK